MLGTLLFRTGWGFDELSEGTTEGNALGALLGLSDVAAPGALLGSVDGNELGAVLGSKVGCIVGEVEGSGGRTDGI